VVAAAALLPPKKGELPRTRRSRRSRPALASGPAY
jgi:hypothetical protein